jgi:hypothetical protein
MLIKLTDQNNQTYGATTWGEGVTHKARGERGQGLCSSEWIHFYEHPLVAVLMNPIQGKFNDPIGWECKPGRIIERDGLKAGARILTTIRRVDLPELSTNQRVEIAIRCALSVYAAASFVKWANAWIDGSDRTQAAARAARAAAEATAWSAEATWAAAEAARAAAWAAAEAARAAARAAAWAAAEAAEATAWSAEAAAESAAEAAARAARAADFDLISICEEVVSNHVD